jgi:hypothetical protein
MPLPFPPDLTAELERLRVVAAKHEAMLDELARILAPGLPAPTKTVLRSLAAHYT